MSSNLDRRPPIPRGKKRKSEASAQQPPPKKRGRPRLSEQRRLAAEQEAKQEADKEASAASEANETAEEEAPKMATRRMTRRSAATMLEPVTSAEAAPEKRTSKKQRKSADDEVAAVNHEDADATTGHENEPEPVSPTVNKPTTRRAAKANTSAIASSSNSRSQEAVDLLALGLSKTNAPRKGESTEHDRYASMDYIMDKVNGPNIDISNGVFHVKGRVYPMMNGAEGSSSAPPRPLTNGAAPSAFFNGVTTAPVAARVELFARVYTSTGITELPMVTDNLAADVQILQAYAKWMNDTGTPLPFDIFKSIYTNK